MAKSISVAVADIDTMVAGCDSRVSSPSAPVTVIGKVPPDELGEAGSAASDAPPPQAVRPSTSARGTASSGRERGRGTGMASRAGGGGAAHEPPTPDARPLPRGSGT
jgi:hypothetical protein